MRVRAVAAALLLLSLVLAPPTYPDGLPPAGRPPAGRLPAGRLSPARAERIIAGRAGAVVRALKQRDTTTLARFVHPDRGVRFSPSVFLEKGEGRTFTRAQVRRLSADRTRYLWGHHDGSGEPMRLRFSDYYKRFVFPRDFTRARKVLYNTPTQRGNTRKNTFSVHPRAIHVEYYLPQTAPDKAYDWASLNLIFEQKNGVWYLVGIVHDGWTI